MTTLKKSPRSKKKPRHPLRPQTALTVSVVGGSQVGCGTAIHDGVGRQVCEEGQSPHQPRSICRRERVVRCCQPRAPIPVSWGLRPTLKGIQGSVQEFGEVGIDPSSLQVAP